jgi:hypothetical protein
VFITAQDVACHYSVQRPNTTAALAGQVFGMRFQIQSKRSLTFASSFREPNITANAAAVTKAIVSTMVPNQQVFVIATTV